MAQPSDNDPQDKTPAPSVDDADKAGGPPRENPPDDNAFTGPAGDPAEGKR